jgi:Na+/glutamate symporter
MIADHTFWHLTEATFGIIIVALIGSIGVWQGKRGRRVETKMDQALTNQDTGNNKQLGETVHDMAQTQEILSAQIHTNTREVVVLSQKLDQHIDRHDQELEDGTGR